jgi:hypothetical protein
VNVAFSSLPFFPLKAVGDILVKPDAARPGLFAAGEIVKIGACGKRKAISNSDVGTIAMPEQREQFQSRINALVEQVRQWVEPNDWVTKPYAKRLRDPGGEIFEIPALFLQKGPIRVLLDPVAYDVPGAEGVVDLYLMPTYDDLASLYFEGGEWRIHYAFPPDPKETHSVVETKTLALSAGTVNEVLESIAAHAEPSF